MLTKHTIPLKDYLNFPELNPEDCEQLNFVDAGATQIQVYVGKQDGFFVSGYHLAYTGRGVIDTVKNPSRKYGEYPTRNKAVLGAIEAMLSALYFMKVNYQEKEVEDMIYMLDRKKNEVLGTQIKLW